jgi:hypothetical protein
MPYIQNEERRDIKKKRKIIIINIGRSRRSYRNNKKQEKDSKENI